MKINGCIIWTSFYDSGIISAKTVVVKSTKWISKLNRLKSYFLNYMFFFLLTPQLSAQQGAWGNSNHFRISNPDHHWVIGIDSSKGITHFGLDSENTGREETNLLAGPINLNWDEYIEKKLHWKKISESKFETTIESGGGKGTVKWLVSENQGDMLWQIEYSGKENIRDFRIEIPMSALEAAAVLIPAKLDKKNQGLGPWLLVAPDFGHLLVTSDSDIQLVGINDGVRGSGGNAISTGVDPRLRGPQWLEATGIKDFKAGKLNLRFCSTDPISDGQKIILRFHMSELHQPEGIEIGLWGKIRRPYLNNWQPCGTWAGPKERWYYQITFYLTLHLFHFGFILTQCFICKNL